jgi:hypothetical protein
MALLEITVEQILSLIQQLPRDRKQVIYQALNQELMAERETDCDEETKVWLEADLMAPLPEYDWGEKGIPEGYPVCYSPGQGLMIQGIED